FIIYGRANGYQGEKDSSRDRGEHLMRKRGRPPFGNAYALGYVEASRLVSDRIYSKQTTCHVWMLANGDLIVREATETRFSHPGDEHLIGTYLARTPSQLIADDLLATIHDRAGVAA